MRVGIVGCGKVADKHISSILRIPGTEIVGVCDQEALMAGQLAERFGVPYQCTDIGTLLTDCRPDIIHITTPPQSHFPIAMECLQRGCHVYVEKPFTVRLEETKRLLDIAEARGLNMTVGHETQFNLAAQEMRSLVRGGFLGGHPVHIESVYCYDLGDERYARALLGDRNHWVRRLPGGLLHNVVSHGIGKIAEYLRGNDEQVWAVGFTSPFLKSIGAVDVLDEVRVTIVDECGTTAYFTFSSQISPSLHAFALYGPKNSLVADHEHQTVIKLSRNYRSYANQLLPPFTMGRQYKRSGWRNIRRFLRRELHTDSGIHTLMSSFYRSVEQSHAPPIPYGQILRTSRITEKIIAALGHGALAAAEQRDKRPCHRSYR